MTDLQAFDSRFKTAPIFDKMAEVIDHSPSLVKALNEFTARGGEVVVGQPGYGTYFNSGTNVITIDAQLLGGRMRAETVVTVLGHELGHALDDKYLAVANQAHDPMTSANAGLQSEGVALNLEYCVAKELNTRMYSSMGSDWQERFDQCNSVEERCQLGAELMRTAHPSGVGNMTYEKYYSAAFACAASGIRVLPDQWQEMEDSNVCLLYKPDGGWTFKATFPPGNPMGHFTDVVSDFDEKGEPLSVVAHFRDLTGLHQVSLHRGLDGEYTQTVTDLGALRKSFTEKMSVQMHKELKESVEDDLDPETASVCSIFTFDAEESESEEAVSTCKN